MTTRNEPLQQDPWFDTLKSDDSWGDRVQRLRQLVPQERFYSVDVPGTLEDLDHSGIIRNLLRGFQQIETNTGHRPNIIITSQSQLMLSKCVDYASVENITNAVSHNCVVGRLLGCLVIQVDDAPVRETWIIYDQDVLKTTLTQPVAVACVRWLVLE